MIRTLLALDGALIRGALAFVLRAEADIEVVAEVGRFEELPWTALAHRPDVIVLDAELLPPDGLGRLWGLDLSQPAGRVLLLTEARRSPVLDAMLAGHPPRLGFLTKAGPPQRLVAAVRSTARGERVLDPELVVHAVRQRSPLTPRETQVLSFTAEGAPVTEIASRLALSPGTVRNHLSRVIGKVGARTRIEAVRIAHDAGWI